MKLVYRIVGFVVVLAVVLFLLLSFLNSKGLLGEDLANLVNSLSNLGCQAANQVSDYVEESGIEEKATDLWQQGVDKILGSAAPSDAAQPTEVPVSIVQP